MTKLQDGVLSNTHYQERQRQRKKRKEVTTESDWRAVLGTVEGRRLLMQIIVKSRFPLVGFQPDPRRQDYDAGAQSIGAWINDEASKHARSLLRVMQDEHSRVEQLDSIERDQVSPADNDEDEQIEEPVE